jgi:hypothetical protein
MTIAFDHDVCVVGGGPAGSSAAVFTAREGLDTVVFDRGNSSLRQCAYLENYPGFPAGVDVETAYDLFHDHVREAGGEVVDDLVASVEPLETGFRVTTQEGRELTTERVVAASTYDDSYLLDLHDAFAVVETDEDGEESRHFDYDHPNEHGRTAVDGLYVAGPLGGVESQVAIAVGHGARVGVGLLTDRNEAAGLWAEAASHTDWVVKQGRYAGEEWLETVTGYYAERAPESMDEETARERARALAEEQQDWQIPEAEVERRRETGHRELARRLDSEAVLDAVDDERIREYAAGLDGVEASGDD